MKKCIQCGRETNKLSKGLCSKHYMQLKRYGKFLDDNPRTKFDPNEIIIYDNYAEIVIYDKNCLEIAKTKIDIEDVERVKNLMWCNNGDGYIISNKNSKHSKFYLHRFIMKYDGENFIDHINHNKLDNRKCNLRIVNPQQNMMNRIAIKPTSSGIVGVNYVKKTKKWKSVIMLNRKTIFLGYYDDINEAIKARKEAEVKYFNDYINQG